MTTTSGNKSLLQSCVKCDSFGIFPPGLCEMRQFFPHTAVFSVEAAHSSILCRSSKPFLQGCVKCDSFFQCFTCDTQQYFLSKFQKCEQIPMLDASTITAETYLGNAVNAPGAPPWGGYSSLRRTEAGEETVVTPDRRAGKAMFFVHYKCLLRSECDWCGFVVVSSCVVVLVSPAAP